LYKLATNNKLRLELGVSKNKSSNNRYSVAIVFLQHNATVEFTTVADVHNFFDCAAAAFAINSLQ